MNAHKRLAILTGTVLALAAGTAVAADREDIQAFGTAKTSLTQAIDRAATQANGKAIDAEFDAARTGNIYEIKVLTADKLLKLTVNADTGAVVKTDNERLEHYFTSLDPADLRNAKTSLTQAIGIAEQSLGGKAISAEAERESNHVEYEVTVVRPDGTSEDITINGLTGQVAER